MIKETFVRVKEVLDRYYETREEVIKLVRELLGYSREIVQYVHQKQFDHAIALLDKACRVVKQVNNIGRIEPRVRYSGLWLDTSKEYAEAVIFLNILKAILGNTEVQVPFPEDLGISEEAWILGLCEVAGELKREILLAARENNFALARRILLIIDEIYSCASSLSYPSAIIPGIKSKIDYVRAILVSSEELIFRLEKEHELLEKMDKMLKKK